MIKKFFHALLLRRRFWRYATMSEVAEIYMSRILRITALNMVSAFVVIYLYQNGFSIAEIAFIWAGMYAVRTPLTLPLATLVSWIGPKHATFVSNILYIPAMILISLTPEYGYSMLFPALILQGLSTVLYGIAYTVNFSKVKSVDKAGKEIALMNIFEKITTGLSPMIGGFLAFIFGPQAVIAISAVLFLFAAAPLFKTGEPVQTRRVLKLRGFPWRLFFSQFSGHFAIGFDIFASGVVWSLFVAITIIGIGGDNEVYAITGVLLSVVFLVALVFSHICGRIIDKNKGWQLYKIGVLTDVAIHAIRPFITTTIAVAGLNAAREASHTAYALPYTKGMFDTADVSGARSTYLGLVNLVNNLGSAAAAAALGLLALALSEVDALRVFFFVAAAAMMLLLTIRFPLYRK